MGLSGLLNRGSTEMARLSSVHPWAIMGRPDSFFHESTSTPCPSIPLVRFFHRMQLVRVGEEPLLVDHAPPLPLYIPPPISAQLRENTQLTSVGEEA